VQKSFASVNKPDSGFHRLMGLLPKKFSVLRRADLNIFQKLKVLISCHPDDLHIVFDDKGWDFLIFGNHDGPHRAGI